MIVGSPAPGVAADWHRALNVAAAKLAVAAGVGPAHVRRISGLRRVEIKREHSQIIRQLNALAHAAVLTADPIPDELLDTDKTAERILTGRSADEIGSLCLAVCARARRYERMHIYFDQTEAFTHEYTALSNELFRCRDKVKSIEDEYDIVGERLTATADLVTRSTSWPTRQKLSTQIDELVQRRDRLRAIFARTCQETGVVMEQLRYHHAKRAYWHSRYIPEFRDEAKLFVPASSMHKMMVCPHEEVRLSGELRDRALHRMEEWNGYCEQFAIQRRSIRLEHKQDELLDHVLRTPIADPPRLRTAGQSNLNVD